MKKLVLTGPTARDAACRYIAEAPDGHVVVITDPPRNLEQNAALWAMLGDLERQCQWHGINLTAEEWKDLLSAGLTKSKVVPNLEGSGFVILGQRTRRMSKRHFSELLELVRLFGDQRQVKWGGAPCDR
jgi:hypothetical protein